MPEPPIPPHPDSENPQEDPSMEPAVGQEPTDSPAPKTGSESLESPVVPVAPESMGEERAVVQSPLGIDIKKMDATPNPVEAQPGVDVEPVRTFREEIHKEMHKVIVGQGNLIDELLITILANGHALLEGVPGVAKTLISKTLAKMMGMDFRRIQFTPDLMPADIIGTKVFDLSNSTFTTQKGPIFSNVVLIDEVNRAPAKTQSALLEVMEERQVTIEGQTFVLDPPFMVLATQNPIEFEGTYNLPEAQMDRFLMKINVDYPSEQNELEILRRFHSGALQVGRDRAGKVEIDEIVDAKALAELRAIIREVRVEDKILEYINRLVRATRSHGYLFIGSSPRGNISLLLSAKAHAALKGRNYVNPDDVKTMALPVLRHRVMLSPEAEIEGMTTDQILGDLADQTEVPR
jgi:MoxR-like ATPase